MRAAAVHALTVPAALQTTRAPDCPADVPAAHPALWAQQSGESQAHARHMRSATCWVTTPAASHAALRNVAPGPVPRLCQVCS